MILGVGYDVENDPRDFPAGMTPAVVEYKVDDPETDHASFMTVEVRDSGALYYRQWNDRSGVIPSWRWAEVHFIQTEAAGELSGRQRIVESDWRLLPEEVRETIGEVET